MEDPARELQNLLVIEQPPGAAELVHIAEQLEKWLEGYTRWHRDHMKLVAKATLQRHRQLLERVPKVSEAEAIETLKSDHEPHPVIVGDEGQKYDGTAFYASMKEVHDAAAAVDAATESFMDIFTAVDRMLGDSSKPDDNRPLRRLAEALVSVLVPFSFEVQRLKEGSAIVMARLGRHPEEIDDLEKLLASHVAILAGGGHSDGAIARILSESCPSWAASAVARVRAEAGGEPVSPALEGRRIQELLKERVRKMRAERGIPAGSAVKAGTVDPLRALAEFVETPEADEDVKAPGESEDTA
jgi:hypothetical protein